MAFPPRSLTAPPLTLTSRLPVRVQGQPLGSKATVQPTQSLNRAPVTITQPGSAQAEEQFNHPDVHPAVGRMLNDLQKKINEAIGQTKADPTSNKNLLEGVTLTASAVSSGQPTNPTIIAHGLAQPYRGYRVCTVRGGTLVGHAALPATAANPTTTHLILFTHIAPWASGGTVQADIEVWA